MGKHVRRRRSTVYGVLAEVSLTAAVVGALFLGYQLWWGDAIVGSTQQEEADEIADHWGGYMHPSDDNVDADYGPPPIVAAADHGEEIGILRVPRFGEDYARVIREGTNRGVINQGPGHYSKTQQLGELGNFALAGHRSTYGAPFADLDKLQAGDKLYIQTKAGTYTYVFQRSEIVRPTAVEVLAPVPGNPGATATERTLTMTACHPRHFDWERIIGYSVFESWTPAGATPRIDEA